MAEETGIDDEILDDDGIIRFDHKFFTSIEGGYFRKSQDEQDCVFVIKLTEDDDAEVSLPLDGIKREFELEHKADGKKLDQIEKALNFVRVLKIGDSLPTEILTGEASWKVSEKHLKIAHQRLTLQLVSWLTGDEHSISTPGDLARMVEDPKIKEKINEAFEEAAEKTGFGRENKEQVVNLIATLANELAHIEALRDQFANVLMMEQKTNQLRKVYANELSMMEIITPVMRLIIIAVKEYKSHFDQIDARTSEVISVLKNLGAQTKFIHQIRDDLFCRLSAWEEMFIRWNSNTANRSPETEELLRKTYQFLAPRFMQADEWVLFTQLSNSKEMKTAMRW